MRLRSCPMFPCGLVVWVGCGHVGGRFGATSGGLRGCLGPGEFTCLSPCPMEVCAALTHRQVHVDGTNWLHLRGHPGAWVVTDGYGWRSWSFVPEEAKVRHAARRLGVEGGRNFWHANAAFDANSGQKKWIPPPMKVWIQKETFNATSHPVLDAELSSVSTSW